MTTRWARSLGIVFVVVLSLVAGVYTYFNGTFWGRESADKQLMKSLHEEFAGLTFHQMGPASYNFKDGSYDVAIVFQKLSYLTYFFELRNGKATNFGTNGGPKTPLPKPYTTSWINNAPASSPVPHVVVDNWSSGMGTVSAKNTSFNQQKLSFTAFVSNNTKQEVDIDTVQVLLPSALKDHIASGSELISVGKALGPNKSLQVSSYFILNTKGMTKEQIMGLGKIEGFIVNVKH